MHIVLNLEDFRMRQLSPIIGVLLLLVGIVIACLKEDPVSEAYSFNVYREGSVNIAETIGGPKYSELLFQYTPVCTLNQDENREESLLFHANRYFMGRDGNFYVQDNGNFRIAVFDNNGEYIRSIGREGEGPGEFIAAAILWIHEETIAVVDEGNRRTTLFNTDGTYIESRLFADFPRRVILHPADNRNVLVSSNSARLEDGKPYIQTPEVTFTTIKGRVIKNIQAIPFSLGTMHIIENFGPVVGTAFYSAMSGILYHPVKGLLIYNSGTPELYWYNTSGKHISTYRLDLDLEMVTAEDRIGIRRYMDERVTNARREIDRRAAEVRRKRYSILDTKAYWTNVIIDDYGYLWLRMFRDYNKILSVQGAGLPYRVVSSDGEYLGNTTWPECSSATVSNGHLLTYLEDIETGETTFVVYSIQSSVEGLEYFYEEASSR